MQFVQIKENEFSNLFEGKLCRLRLPVHVSKHPLKTHYLELLFFFVFFRAHLDDGGANCEPLAGLELCGEGEEATVLHIQVVVHLGGGELETLSGQNLKLFLCNMLIYGCPLQCYAK